MYKKDKRICELWLHSFYLYYTLSNVRHNHTHFLQIPSLLQTKYDYDGELIAEVWRDYLTTYPAPPTNNEMLLAMVQESKLFKCSTLMFSPFYKLPGKNRRTRINAFRDLKVTLMPKIHHDTFHEHVYLFMKELKNITVVKALTGIK